MAEIDYGYEIRNRLSSLERTTSEVYNKVDYIGNEVRTMSGKVERVNAELQKLARDFEAMMNEQRKTAAIQQATTELVRIRQELEQKFGGYMNVRETMLGVLQATDVALVKENTISRVAEELMITTPEYWLAPCLVAVSAWICNDRDLAERAIVEAVKRNEEHTALTMALICRRNNRTETCYEWLSIYFARQQATRMSEKSYAYIDAYVNGIFGPDEKHMCDDYISKWLDEIRGSSSTFENDQETIWKNYCGKFKGTVDTKYPILKACVSEYDKIDAYLGRVNSVDAIQNNFSQMQSAYINQDVLKEKIDKNLIDLIRRYDGEEEELRREEELQQAIKELDGDVLKAKQLIQYRAEKRKEQRMNLVEQMSNAITSEKDVLPSQKKTAISFLGSYIKRGFRSYLDEGREKFPTSITMNVNGWTGQTTDGSNLNELCESYRWFMENNYNNEAAVIINSKPTKYLVGGIGCIVGALILLFVFWPLGIALLVAGGISFLSMKKFEKNKNERLAELRTSYDVAIQQGYNTIAGCMNQWKEAKNVATEFSAMPIPKLIV